MEAHDADRLLTKYAQGALTEPERVRLEAWLDRSPENRRQLEQSLTAWQLVPDPAGGMDFATGPAWELLAQHLPLETAAPVYSHCRFGILAGEQGVRFEKIRDTLSASNAFDGS